MANATHARKCILSKRCNSAGSSQCNALCGSYIAIHGHSGNGGRSGSAGLPQDYRLVTLANSLARTEQAEAYKLVDDYAATFVRQHEPDGKRIKSLYLFSLSPGTGKTTTAAALLSEYISVHYIGSLQRNRQPLERPAVFLDVNAWQTDYNEFNRSKVPDHIAEPAADRYYRKQAAASTAPFAVLDDIGVRSASEAFRADLHTVINARTTAGLPTVYTSNIPMRELATVFDARLADRVRDQCVEVPFVGGSKRGMR